MKVERQYENIGSGDSCCGYKRVLYVEFGSWPHHRPTRLQTSFRVFTPGSGTNRQSRTVYKSKCPQTHKFNRIKETYKVGTSPQNG